MFTYLTTHFSANVDITGKIESMFWGYPVFKGPGKPRSRNSLSVVR